jgi:addiction module RelE/StbE family toxin
VRVEYAPRARDDLDSIWEFIARDNEAAATRWIETLLEAAERAGAHPRAGRVVPEIGDPSIREIIHRGYRIVYRIDARRVIVLTVLEGHRRLRAGR